MPGRTAAVGAAMKQLEVGDPREDHLYTAKDDEGTALDGRAKLKWRSPTLGRPSWWLCVSPRRSAEGQGAPIKAQGWCTRDGSPSCLFSCPQFRAADGRTFQFAL